MFEECPTKSEHIIQQNNGFPMNQNPKTLKSTFALFAVSIAILMSCAGEPTQPDSPQVSEVTKKLVIENTVKSVILPLYLSLALESDELLASVKRLRNLRTLDNLNASRTQWRKTREPWEQCEGFLFGPVEQQGIDPFIDSWPLNRIDLDAVLSSSATLTKDYINTLEGTQKGFHTIEYLIFGIDGAKTVGQITDREFDYLVGCTESLTENTNTLHDLWKVTGGNFSGLVITAGEAGNVNYPSRNAALQEFVNGIIGISDEVGNGKIQNPLQQSDVTLEESRFSSNSKADFADNIRGVKLMYTGNPVSSNSNTLSSLMRVSSVAKDDAIRAAIEKAIVDIETIPGTFTTAIIINKPAVQKAQTSVRALQQILEQDLFPYVQSLR